MDFSDTIGVSGDGMRAQAKRLRIASENLANKDTTGSTPGADAYRRKVLTFKSTLDRRRGVSSVGIRAIEPDNSPFEMRYDPSHPAADSKGYVKVPNVKTMVEIMDMHEAQHSYDANVDTMQITRSMLTRTINIMR